jgi:ubiquinone/menaquinone biosynthesis C-methylase UbiE
MYLMESPGEGRRVARKTDRPLTLAQLHFAGVAAGQRVVDIGCAVGTTTEIIADLVAPNGEVVGIDTSEQRLAAARTSSMRASVGYRLGAAESLPAHDGEFDTAWCRFLLEYLPKPELAVAEMCRVVRAGGTVCVADLDGNGIWTDPLDDKLEQERAAAVETLGRTGFDPRVGRRLYRMCVEAGLRNIRIDLKPYNVLPGPIRDEAARERWEQKYAGVARALCGQGWPQGRASALIDAMRRRLDIPGSFSYSVLITVVGHMPGKD